MSKYHILSTTIALSTILVFAGCDWCNCCKVQKEKESTQATIPAEKQEAKAPTEMKSETMVNKPMQEHINNPHPSAIHPMEEHPMPIPLAKDHPAAIHLMDEHVPEEHTSNVPTLPEPKTIPMEMPKASEPKAKESNLNLLLTSLNAKA